MILVREIIGHTRDNSVENRFSAVKISKPSSSSSSPELPESFPSDCCNFLNGRVLRKRYVKPVDGVVSVSLSRPIDVCRCILWNGELIDSSSESLNSELIFRVRPPKRLNAVLVVLLFDSDGSRLPARGVTNPPPSTAMGIMYSRGLFFIGCDEFDVCNDDGCVPIVVVDAICVSDVSESLVDCRDNTDL